MESCWVLLQLQLIRSRPSSAVIFLSFLMLSQAAAAVLALSADPTPADCEPGDCGGGLKISYPFWIGGVQNSYCGYPGYNVSCDAGDGTPYIDDGVQTYVIRNILYDMSLVVAEYSTEAAGSSTQSSPCPLHVPRHNVSFSRALFNLSSVNRQLLFYLNCTATAPGLSAIEECAGDDGRGKVSFVADRQSPTTGSSVSPPPPCESVVVTPYLQGEYGTVDGRSYGSLLGNGFLLEWRAPNCKRCRSSGGRCGYNKTDHYFMCICSDRVHRVGCDGQKTSTLSGVKEASWQSFKQRGWEKRKKMAIGLAAGVGGLLLAGVLCFLLSRRRRNMRARTGPSSTRPLFRTTTSSGPPSLKDLRIKFSNHAVSAGNDVSDVPLLDFKSVKTATSNFSDEYKLGEGGFGPVYKGTLLGGDEVAVKRLSKLSKQGHQEFSNEVRLIAKLQHKNLVRLLGSCAHQDEKLLIYEYMPNKSLDKFIFDPRRSAELSWQKRFAIIQGIANGLLYLHHYSRMRVIHRDLKTGNVLLDREMNPKISDFGLARIFGADQMEANTGKVVGTFGYMSPEYASQGLFSEKSDVFSFGVILLEIITGERSTSFYPHKNSQTLLGYVWQMWEEGRALELLDPSMGSSPSQAAAGEVLKCTQLGLLCVQQDAAERPSMYHVVSSLSSETCVLPSPGQPAFANIGRDPKPPVPPVSHHRASVNGLTLSSIGGR